jgi:drug/metabolite transporter (DMT)-like permease
MAAWWHPHACRGESSLNPAYLIAALGSVLYGGADFCGGLAARRAAALAVTFMSGFTGLAVLFLGLPLVHGVTRAPDLLWGIAGGAFGGIGAMLVYRALAIGPVSVASPILGVTGLALPVLVGIALGERPSPTALAGLGLAPVSIVLLGRSHGGGGAESARVAGVPAAVEVPRAAGAGDPRRVVVAALTAGAVLGFFLVFLARIESGASLWPLIAARLAGLLCLLVALAWRRESLLPAKPARWLALITGALDSSANLAYVASVQRGSLSLVAALVSLAPATTVLLAGAILSERWNALQVSGLLLALAAGVCIAIG